MNVNTSRLGFHANRQKFYNTKILQSSCIHNYLDSMMIKLSELPNEIIYQIFLCVPPASVTRVQQVSRQFNEISQPVLWRYYCQSQYEYWDPKHDIQEKLSWPIAKADWRKIFSARHKVDRITSGNIDSILENQQSRVKKTESIVTHGYDAKDTLLKQLKTSAEANDVLARRFYSDAVLGNLHRRTAVQEWAKLRNGEQVPLERALAAFDMFVLHERKGDFNEVTTALDRIAEQVRRKDPELNERSPRERATRLAKFLRENNLVGIESDAHYQHLQNNFIGIALQDSKHPSLPLISVAIYCCVARRLGIDAHPCGFPFHLIAIVKSPPGRTLEGCKASTGEAPPPMYMDPFRSAQETDVRDLQAQLQSLGVAPSDYLEFLDESPVNEMIRRCAKNIVTSVQALPRHNGAGPMSTVPSFPEMDGALYAALWALMLLPEPEENIASFRRGQYLRFIVEKMESEYLTDVGLIEEHILPFISDPAQRESLINTIRVVRTADQKPKQMKRRSSDTEGKVLYKVGQVFQHKRYNYQAVITGWDVECEAGDQWITTMNVRSLSRGQHQSFYHVLVEDKSVRYVAEENIEMTSREPSPTLMALAGQHFKRWDEKAKAFVSNIKDEYPED